MSDDKIRAYLDLATTTVLGTVGALTGNLILQAAAFFPAVVYQISSDFPKLFFNNESMNNELKSLVKKACNLTQEKLSQTSETKAQFFLYAKTSIEEGINQMTPSKQFIQTLQEKLNTEASDQAIDMTPNDIREISKLFVNYFTDKLPNYPELKEQLLKIILCDHENRITALEAAQSLPKESMTFLPNEISDDSKYYYDKFEEPLFLHKGLSQNRIALRDVYVHPRAEIKKQYQWNKIISKGNQKDSDKDTSYTSIEEALREFIEYCPQMPGEKVVDVLFIEGKAAMGKSSLSSWLCWNYMKKTKDARDILGNRRLITIKLRDIPRSSNSLLNVQSPFLQLCAYLTNKKEEDLASTHQWLETGKMIFQNSILVLEGFDELCLFEDLIGNGKNVYFQNLYYELNRMNCNCKIVVTTRPDYLNVEPLDFPKAHLDICPFKETEREKWFEKYECFDEVSPTQKETLIHGGTSILEGIVDSPLTLYMIVARKVDISDNLNLWHIYQEIFAEEIYMRDYEKGAPHATNKYRESLCRLTAEIANAVSREQHLSIAVDKLLDITQIQNLLDQLGGEENIQHILEDCFGLASYFRTFNSEDDNGKQICAVEFYHNNIKDYFYCEYLWFHLEDIYSNIPSDLQVQEKWFIGSFQELFQYSICLKDSIEGVRARSIDFLESKILYLKEENITIDFINQELKQHYFKHFFGKMLQTGFLCHYEYTGKNNILHMMACIYSSVLSIYHTLYLPYLGKNEQIAMAEDSHTAVIGVSFIYRILFMLSNLYDLSHLKFDGIMLSGIEFGKHNFQNSSFRGCLLIGCNFDECDLRGADFSSASLQNADFRNAIIDESTVFSKTTQFEHTKIARSQRPYFTPWVDEDLFCEENECVTYIAPPTQK